ncbi:MAG: hypothetical protein ACR2PO_09880 [Methyloligellaceae bacterium]
MMRGAAILMALALVAIRPAYGQSLYKLCLRADTSGDATINCQRALMLLEQKQLEVLLDIRRLIARGTNRSIAETVKNTGLANRQLSSIARALQQRRPGPSSHLFVSDLREVGGSVLECPDGDDCGEEARAAADGICRKFGYGGQHAHEFAPQDEPPETIRVKWVVCRP